MTEHSRVLVVDDEAGPRESLKIILKSEFEVTTTDRGSTALELLAEQDFDIVLLDLTMPDDLSGTETLRRIRDTAIDVEAIVITGQGALDTAVDCLRLGARDYIAKPYRAEDVRNAIRAALAARTARHRASEMREHLLENLSHEFRTPLNAISGYTEIIADEGNEILSDEQRHALARIELNSKRLLSYLEGLFFLAELDSGGAPTGAREFAVRPWLDQLVLPIRRDAENNGVTVAVQCDSALTGRTQPETLGRLLSALTYAAADQPAGGRLRVAASRLPDGSLQLSLDPGRTRAPESVGSRCAGLEDLRLTDPLAREVIHRSAASLGARIMTEMDDDSILRVHLQVPCGASPKDGFAATPHAATSSLTAQAR